MFPDAVAMGGYPIDIHSPDGAAMKHTHLTPGSWYSIPYRSLVTREAENLIVAGRCISVTHEACAAVRVTPIVMAMGQAAATAAAIAISCGVKVRDVSPDQVRRILDQNGAIIPGKEKAFEEIL